MIIKNWIINILGGVTKDSQEKTRLSYEEWAVQNLTGKNGEITPDHLDYAPLYDDDICIIRSRIIISNGKIKSLKVAPWCRDVIASSLHS